MSITSGFQLQTEQEQVAQGYVHPSDFDTSGSAILEPSQADRVRSVGEHLYMGAMSAPLSIFDTVGRSVGLLKPGDVDKLATSMNPNFGEYYQNNKNAVSLATDIALAIPLGLGGAAAVRSGSWLYKLVNAAEHPWLAKAFTQEARVGEIVSNIMRQDLNLVNKTRAIDVVTGNVDRAAAVSRAQVINQIDNLKRYMVGETAIALFMNQSENIYPSDMGLVGNLLLHGAGLGVTGAIEFAALRNQIRSSLLRPEFREAVQKSIFAAGLPDEIRAIKNDRDLALTVYALNSAEQRATKLTASGDLAEKLRENANAYELAFDGIVKNIIENTIKDGLPEILPKPYNTEKITQTILRAGKNDPTIYPGMQTATNVPLAWSDVDGILTAQQKKIDKLTEKLTKVDDLEEAGKIENELRTLEGIRFFILEEDGTFTPIAKRKPQWHDNPTEIVTKKPEHSFENVTYELNMVDPETKINIKMGMDHFGIIYLPKDTTVHNFSPYHMTAAQGLIQKLAQNFDWEAHTAAMKRVPLKAFEDPKKLNNDYFTLEFANAFFNRKDVDFNKAKLAFQFPDTVAGSEKEWIEWELLKRKYDIFKNYRDKIERYNNSPDFKFPTWVEPVYNDLKILTNLPAGKFGAEHPAIQVFEALYKQGEKTLVDGVKDIKDFYTMMKTSALDAQRMFDSRVILTEDRIKDWFKGKLTTDGGLFNRPKMQGGEYYPASLVALKPIPYNLTQETLTTVATARYMQFISEFANPETTPELIKNFTDKFISSPIFDAAKTVKSIAEGQQTGSGILTSQQRSTSRVDTFTAVDQIATLGERQAFKVAKDLFEQHQDTWIALRKKENAGSMYNFAEFSWARRFGFEIDDIERMEDGKVRFKLKTEDGEGERLSERNVQAFKRMYKEDIDPRDDNMFFLPKFQPVEKLKAANHAVMEVDDLAFQAIDAIDGVAQQLLQSTNFFRKLYGYGEINAQKFYIPPQNLTNQYIKYIVYPAEGGGQPFKQMVTGRTPAELNTKLDKVIGALKEEGKQYDIIDQNQMRQFFNLYDETFFNMVDRSDSLAQTGITKGSTASPILMYGNQVLSDAIAAVENQTLSLSRRTISALFENELSYARMADALTRTGEKVKDPNTRISIWRQYAGRLLSDQRILSDPTIGIFGGDTGILFDRALNKLNATIKSFMPEKSSIYNQDAVTKINTVASKDFDALREQLGGYLPFSDTADFVQNTFKLSAPKTAREIAGTLNTVTANLTLRILDAGNAYVSLLGNIVSMPLVMNMFKRQSWDDEASFAARTGIFGIQVDKDYSIPSTARMGAKTIAFAMSKEGKEVIDEAYNVYGNLQKRMSDAFDAIHDPLADQNKIVLNKVINKLSYVSDKGEEVARGWAYLTGYLIAKDGYKVANAADRHMIANVFANHMIADYRGTNKPQVFQGALGSVLGMFQTYMWNYYARMFSYIENKNYRALAINYAMQGAVFGAQSVPGWEQFNNLYMTAYDGRHDIVDSLDAKYGPAMSSLLLHGTFSNIPKLFSKDGINIYSRGDVNVSKVPAFISPANAPIFNIAQNAVGFFGELVNQFKTGGQINAQQTLEALGTYNINRPFGRVMELLAGTSVDRRGAVISNDVRTTTSVISRIMGLRPMSESASIEALHRVATAEVYQRDLYERIQNSVRSIFRGNPSAETVNHALGQAISDYIKAGGNPRNASTFIKDAIISAYISKQDRKLLSVLHSPGRTNDMIRLINSMTQYDED